MLLTQGWWWPPILYKKDLQKHIMKLMFYVANVKAALIMPST